MEGAARVAEYLAVSPLFACLSADDRLLLAQRMRSKRFARDEVIFHRDDPASHLYVILAGTVKIALPDARAARAVSSVFFAASTLAWADMVRSQPS